MGYEVLAGNTRDEKTVAGMLDRLQARFGLAERTLCMDRGMVTAESLKVLRASEVRYVLADRRTASQQFAEQVKAGSWKVIQADEESGETLVEVQEVGQEEGNRLILVRSQGCRRRQFAGLAADLKRLEESVRKGRLVDKEKIDRRIGAVLARHPGISRRVSVWRETLSATDAKQRPRQVVHWHVDQQREDLAGDLEGVYLLRTNVHGAEAGQVWEDYVTLVRVENAFRTLPRFQCRSVEWQPQQRQWTRQRFR